jgi:hypothetical protein
MILQIYIITTHKSPTEITISHPISLTVIYNTIMADLGIRYSIASWINACVALYVYACTSFHAQLNFVMQPQEKNVLKVS